jgi:SAM-dependent methyltransferase
MNQSAFDPYAESYDAALEKGISISGEGRDYFARGRVEWLRGCLAELGSSPGSVLDFGCGTGDATPHLLSLAPDLVGVDISQKSLEVAARRYGARARFLHLAARPPAGDLDLVFCNGIFHHIAPTARPEALRYIHQSLRAGGLFAFWENNPWNPGTRYVMWRIPFDRDAVPVSSPEARRLLWESGFEVLRTDYLFLFPRPLRWLRWLEPRLSRLPLGAQYQVLCRALPVKGIS